MTSGLSAFKVGGNFVFSNVRAPWMPGPRDIGMDIQLSLTSRRIPFRIRLQDRPWSPGSEGNSARLARVIHTCVWLWSGCGLAVVCLAVSLSARPNSSIERATAEYPPQSHTRTRTSPRCPSRPAPPCPSRRPSRTAASPWSRRPTAATRRSPAAGARSGRASG